MNIVGIHSNMFAVVDFFWRDLSQHDYSLTVIGM